MFCNVNKVVVCTLWRLWNWMMKRYVPDDVLEEASPRGTECCLKNQNYVIRKN
jgi:hypothetical protein